MEDFNRKEFQQLVARQGEEAHLLVRLSETHAIQHKLKIAAHTVHEIRFKSPSGVCIAPVLKPFQFDIQNKTVWVPGPTHSRPGCYKSEALHLGLLYLGAVHYYTKTTNNII